MQYINGGWELMATTLGTSLYGSSAYGSSSGYSIDGMFSVGSSLSNLSSLGSSWGAGAGASAAGSSDDGMSVASWAKNATAIYLGVAKTLDVYYSAKTQKNQLKAQAQQYVYQANQATQNARAATNDMYNAYRMGEYQAMQQGIQDQKIMSHARAQMAGSGVQMGSGSKKEVNQSNEIAHEINQNIIQMNTTSSAMRASLESANYQAQALISNANAQATQIMADSINPLSQAIFSSFMFGAGLFAIS